MSVISETDVLPLVGYRLANVAAACANEEVEHTRLYCPLVCLGVEIGEHIVGNRELHCLGLTGLQGYLLEGFEFLHGAYQCGFAVCNIELYHLFALAAARVGDVHREGVAVEASISIRKSGGILSTHYTPAILSPPTLINPRTIPEQHL